MRERRLFDYMDRKERGTVRSVTEGFRYATADRPSAGRLIIVGVTPEGDPGLTFEEAGDRTDVVWEPPRPSTASRKISLKSASSVRGHMVDIARNRLLTFESMLEYYLANMLLSWRRTVLVEDQPPELKFMFGGVRTGHTFDFRGTDDRNFRTAYAVKSHDQLAPDQTFAKARAIAAAHFPRFADHWLVLCEIQITNAKGWNAIDINEARAVRCERDCDLVLETLRSIGRPTEIWRLQERLSEDAAVWNALLCLHFDGLAQIEKPGLRFTDAARVVATTRH
ncbi:hypothetical protein HLH89_21275 [Rhizobium laguerreae]|uniref:hypothetical protein n=1 Tax=Rhizobium laguerreae TaxID=1076926 RepID=UPI0014781501|nr:hypothetical protein [Rhizobium laguerreae]NNH83544.1 hypothetical protein [Rhizobium laguerreae]